MTCDVLALNKSGIFEMQLHPKKSWLALGSKMYKKKTFQTNYIFRIVSTILQAVQKRTLACVSKSKGADGELSKQLCGNRKWRDAKTLHCQPQFLVFQVFREKRIL